MNIHEHQAKQLLKKYGSISNIRKLKAHTLAQEIGTTKANKVLEYFTSNNDH